MNHYDDLPDTTVWLDSAVSSHYAGPGPTACGCNPTYGQSCPGCDGSEAERQDMWRMPRAERVALELRNHRLDPHWRGLHGEDDGRGAA